MPTRSPEITSRFIDLQQLNQLRRSEKVGDVVSVVKSVPFEPLVAVLRSWQEETRAEFAAPAFLAWMLMRRRNPFFSTGTGWEGHAIAHTLVPGNALDWMIALSKELMASANRNCTTNKMRREMFSILEGTATVQNLRFWNGVFGTALARLHVQTALSPIAREYRQQTYDLLPPATKVGLLRTKNGGIAEQYALPTIMLDGVVRIDLQLESASMSEEDQRALQLLQILGMIGHPSVRDALWIAEKKSAESFVLPREAWRNDQDWLALQIALGRKV